MLAASVDGLGNLARALYKDRKNPYSVNTVWGTICYLNRPHEQYTQVDNIFGTSRTMYLFKSPKHTFLVLVKPAPERCSFRTFSKTLSWKSGMKNVAKCDVYLHILLMGSSYVRKSVCFKENLKSLSSCKPHHPGSGTGMHGYIQCHQPLFKRPGKLIVGCRDTC